MTDKPTPTDAELNTILCDHWPAFAMQSTLVKIWVRDALQDAIDKWGQPTQPQAGAVPLTDEQIKDLQDDGVFLGTCRQIVRAIEAAHGIGIKGGQHVS